MSPARLKQTRHSVVFFRPHSFLVSACKSGRSDVYPTIWLLASEWPIWLFGDESLLTPRVRVCNHARGCVECIVQIFIGVSVNVTHVALHAPTVTPVNPRECNKMRNCLNHLKENKWINKIHNLPELSMAGDRMYCSLYYSFVRVKEENTSNLNMTIKYNSFWKRQCAIFPLRLSKKTPI